MASIILKRKEFYYLDEWISHHLALGIECVWLYDNGFAAYDITINSPESYDPEKVVWDLKPDDDYFTDYSDEDIDAHIANLVEKYKGRLRVIPFVYKKDHDVAYPWSQGHMIKNCFRESIKTNFSDYWLLTDPDEFVHFKTVTSFSDILSRWPEIKSYRFNMSWHKPRTRDLPVYCPKGSKYLRTDEPRKVKWLCKPYRSDGYGIHRVCYKSSRLWIDSSDAVIHHYATPSIYNGAS